MNTKHSKMVYISGHSELAQVFVGNISMEAHEACNLMFY